ncbi:MAG TPA: peptidoglycan editing factor PgeF [Anaerolineales bacterium]
MPFNSIDGLRYFTFDSLTAAGVTHAVFTRQGGVSPQPWGSLNLGGTVGDDPVRVAENRQRTFKALARDPHSLFDVWQVHGNEVVCADAPRPANTPHLKADAILTDQARVTLLMRFADCVPILLVDPVRRVVGLAHAGWQGTLRRVAQAAVQALHERYQSRPADLLAAIGPSIGAHHYEVGPEVAAQVRETFGQAAADLLAPHNGSGRPGVRLDLWAANRLVLEQAGVRSIEVAGLCTACDLDDWFSHRAEKGRTGRFGVMIGL